MVHWAAPVHAEARAIESGLRRLPLYSTQPQLTGLHPRRMEYLMTATRVAVPLSYFMIVGSVSCRSVSDPAAEAELIRTIEREEHRSGRFPKLSRM